MIELDLTPETAVSVLQALIQEEKGFTKDEETCPLRIKKIREVILQIDQKLDTYYEEQK
jgi:hypothetical protein